MNTKKSKIDTIPNINLFTLIPERGYWKSGDYSYQNDLVSHDIRRFGCWEPYETEIFIELLNMNNPNKLMIVDVGAHIGYYTLIAAKCGYKCLSIESHEKIYNVLKMNIELNGLTDKVICVNKFAGEKDDDCNKTITIQSLCKDVKSEILMKVDVEGSDPDVIKGTLNLFKNGIIKYLFVEISPHLRGRETYVNMCREISESSKYQIFDIGLSKPRKLQPVTYHISNLPQNSNFNISDTKQTNFLFIRV